jgi:hypothetical protein
MKSKTPSPQPTMTEIAGALCEILEKLAELQDKQTLLEARIAGAEHITMNNETVLVEAQRILAAQVDTYHRETAAAIAALEKEMDIARDLKQQLEQISPDIAEVLAKVRALFGAAEARKRPPAGGTPSPGNPSVN